MLIIGEGPEKQNLEQLARKYRLENHIMFGGYQKQAAAYLPYGTVFVLPSLTEGLPITLLEAMRAKVPIVATRVGGIPNVLDEGTVSSILVEPMEVTALMTAIETLIHDQRYRIRLSENAYQTLINKYSSTIMAQEYGNVYKRVIGSCSKFIGK